MATNSSSIVDAQALEELEAARTAHSMTPTPDLRLRFPDVNLAIAGSGNTRYWGSRGKTTFYNDSGTYLGGFIGSRSITLGNQEDLEYIWSRNQIVLARLIIYADTLRSCTIQRRPESPVLSLRYITATMILDLLTRSAMDRKVIGLHLVRVPAGFRTRNPNVRTGDWVLAAKYASGTDQSRYIDVFTNYSVPSGF